MTTDTELRDLLATEAGGPAGGPGWDDVLRRGRHRQRMRRVQGVAMVAVLAGVAATALALAADDPAVETTPPASNPTAPTVPSTETTAPTTSTTVPVPLDGGGHIQGARAQGVFVTLIIPWADPASGYDPCVELKPRVVESSEQVGIELTTEDVEGLVPWATCQSSPFTGSGSVELQSPLGDRPLVDLSTGNAVFTADGASLLFPTYLPPAFDWEHWDEFASQGAWTFTFYDGDSFVNITSGYGGTGECDRQTVEVRGTEGRLCSGTAGRYDLHWEEGGRTIAIEMADDDPEEDSGYRLEDVLAIAEGLRLLGD